MTQEVELGSIPKQEVDVNVVIDNIDDENGCVICLETLDDNQSINFHCGHTFHLHCILEWIYNLFDKNADISCPVCRYIECNSSSPYYNVMKILVGYNQTTQHNYRIEVQRRFHNNNVDAASSHQRVYQNNQQIIEDGLSKGFLRFMMCFAFIMICFFCFLIYTFKKER